jgi:hypothetical protein
MSRGSKRFGLRQALRRQPGIYRRQEIQDEFGATKNLALCVLRDMERDNEAVRWGAQGYTRWQILPREIGLQDSLWYHLGWPDPMTWPREGVPLGCVGQ